MLLGAASCCQHHAEKRKKEITDAATGGRKLEKTEKPIRERGCSVTLPIYDKREIEKSADFV